jgi:hypothetical protein
MIKPPVSSPGSDERAVCISPPDPAGAAFCTTLPQLVVDHGNLPMTARHLAEHFARAGQLFERGAHVVRIVHTTEGERIERLNPHSVVLEAHKVCRPIEEKIVRGELFRRGITLPILVAQLYLNLGDGWDLPVLRGICAAPLLSDNGAIDCSPGYHKATALWCIGVNAPAIYLRPSVEDARNGFRLIRGIFASFPFADSVRLNTPEGSTVDFSQDPGADESAFLVGLLTAVCRASLRLAPALLIRAPQLSGSGTGKGLLVHAIAAIAFAQRPKAFTSRGDRQELTKRIESALMQSEPILYLDNCNDEVLVSNVLAQVITEPEVNTRPLGQSQMAPLCTNAFIVVTGNAVQISEDLARRFLVVNLDAKCENPEQRKFAQSFEALVAARRSEILGALLTIWRWGRQTRLEPGMPLGSFERWASWCRDPLLALGCVDPVRRIADLKDQDPARQKISDFFQAWDASHGPKPVKFRDIDPRVICLLDGNAQTRVAKLQRLENARAGGFVLEAIKPTGRWGKKMYVVRRVDA